MTEEQMDAMLRELLEERVGARAGLEGRVLARVAAVSPQRRAMEGWVGLAGAALAGVALVWGMGGKGRAGGAAERALVGTTGVQGGHGLVVGLRRETAGVKEVRREVEGGRMRVWVARRGRMDEAGAAELPALEVGELTISPLTVRPLAAA